MGARKRTGLRQEGTEPRLTEAIGSAVRRAIDQGFVVGREVMIGNVPGIVVGYNIAGIGRFVGNDFPLVVRTALGVTKCGLQEVVLV